MFASTVDTFVQVVPYLPQIPKKQNIQSYHKNIQKMMNSEKIRKHFGSLDILQKKIVKILACTAKSELLFQVKKNLF